jgi:hypothetical protein
VLLLGQERLGLIPEIAKADEIPLFITARG